MEKNFVVYFTNKETITVPISLIKYFLLFETFNEEEGLEIFHVPKRSESDMILWQSMIDILVKHEESMSTVATLNAEIDGFARTHNPRVLYSLIRTCDFYDIQVFLMRLVREAMRRFLTMTSDELYLVYHGDIVDYDSSRQPYEARKVILPEYTRWLALVHRILHVYVKADAVISDMIERFVPRAEHIVAAGNSFNIVITSKGVFSKGVNLYGQANHMDQRYIWEFSSIDFVSTVISVVICRDHTLVLTMNGALYIMGYPYLEGMSKYPDIKGVLELVPLDFVLSMASGLEHGLILTVDGVYAFGRNIYGQLGTEKNKFTKLLVYPPERISINAPVVKIGAGLGYSAFVSKSGDLYLCGDIGNEGRIHRYGSTPTIVSLPAPVSQMACLDGGIVVLLTDGRLYAYGDNKTGELGIQEKKEIREPTQLPSFSPHPIVTIIGERNLITFIDSSDAVYVCGIGVRHLIPDSAEYMSDIKGLLPDGMPNVKIPTRLFASQGYVIDVSTSYTHTLILRQDGLYGFGEGTIGSETDRYLSPGTFYKLKRLDVSIGTEQLHFFDKREKIRKERRGFACHCCGTPHTSLSVFHLMSKKLFCDTGCIATYLSA